MHIIIHSNAFVRSKSSEEKKKRKEDEDASIKAFSEEEDPIVEDNKRNDDRNFDGGHSHHSRRLNQVRDSMEDDEALVGDGFQDGEKKRAQDAIEVLSQLGQDGLQNRLQASPPSQQQLMEIAQKGLVGRQQQQLRLVPAAPILVNNNRAGLLQPQPAPPLTVAVSPKEALVASQLLLGGPGENSLGKPLLADKHSPGLVSRRAGDVDRGANRMMANGNRRKRPGRKKQELSVRFSHPYRTPVSSTQALLLLLLLLLLL